MDPLDGEIHTKRTQDLLDLSELVTEIRRSGACLSTSPGAVVVARDYLLLPSDTWRIACGCTACLTLLCDSTGDGRLVVRDLPASEVPTVEIPITWDRCPYTFTGPEKDPSVGQ